jgi:dienelactone hydrolase
MAAAGYFVVVPDIFHGDPVPADVMKKGGFNFPAWSAKHGADVVDAVVASTIKALRDEHGVKKIGAVGYCFGGRYVLRFLATGKGLDAGFAAHPSMVTTEDIEGVARPVSFALAGEFCADFRSTSGFGFVLMACAETDQAFTPERRAEAEGILQKNKVIHESHLYGGTVHGFAVRTDLSIPQQKFAKESAYHQAIRWFDQWLKNGNSKPSSGSL